MFTCLRRLQSFTAKKAVNGHRIGSVSAISQQRRRFASKSDTFLSGSAGQYADSIYEQWLEDTTAVDESWDVYFKSGEFLRPKSSATKVPSNIATATEEGTFSIESPQAQNAITSAINLMQLVRYWQMFGHFLADLDPLNILNQGVDRRQFVPKILNPQMWGFEESDMDTPVFVGEHAQFIQLMGKSGGGWVTPRKVLDRLREIYAGNIGWQYMHIVNRQRNHFMRQMVEGEHKLEKAEKIRILDRLMWATLFEKFLDIKYPAQKRFGITGGESFVPLLKEIIDEGARLGVTDFVLGMPHRGRLITLATVMRKPLDRMFHEFRGLALPWHKIEDSGDVKYHLGYSIDRRTPDELEVHLSLLPNPSHLEAVNPVVMGKARAKQTSKNDNDRTKTMAILLHGDASFAGQGIVYECMALSDLPHYTTGGVIHVIVNNQIGFTTDPFFARSSPYCTDVARAVAAPIMHVNGDDPESVVRCAKTAVRFRQNFKNDAVIDMLCYRRYGHNEGDEPSFTQPLMYQVINEKSKQNDIVLEKYKKQLLAEGVLETAEINEMEQRINQILIDAYDKSTEAQAPEANWLRDNWTGMVGHHEYGASMNTGITEEQTKTIGNCLTTFPHDFTLHRNLKKIMERRKDNIESGTNIDWGTGEALAIGSLLMEGFHVRLAGQDTERGTFSHRHAVVHEQKKIDADSRPTYIPLQHLPGAQGQFQVINTNLSEFAVLGFEYGYSSESPNSLVIWEAQFGDFANGAQVIFDQFVSSGELKWLRQSGLTILLPHGYEGGGPEHSSARIERYLQMCSDDADELILDEMLQLQQINWQLVNCTTPANLFHVLRRQMHRDFRKPLLVFTPKFGLRHPLASSQLSEFVGADKHFQTVIGENGVGLGENGTVADDKIRKVVFVSGKLWINLVDYRMKQSQSKDADTSLLNDVAIVRLEQISPFPYQSIQSQLAKYPNAELVWAQEEPKNMGPWRYVQPRFETATAELCGRSPTFIGRKASAAPATGYPQVDKHEHAQIVTSVFAKE